VDDMVSPEKEARTGRVCRKGTVRKGTLRNGTVRKGTLRNGILRGASCNRLTRAGGVPKAMAGDGAPRP
jgi:hypothetical protein